MLIKVSRLYPTARLPEYAYPGDSGLDLFSAVDLSLYPGGVAFVPTGIAIELPPSVEAQIRSRSGLALKHQVVVLNSPGTIDSTYRGEIAVILYNHGPDTFVITSGMKIAQMVICPVLSVQLQESVSLSSTVRSDAGFGSTGI
jgi:dUTP pyrophosphatase